MRDKMLSSYVNVFMHTLEKQTSRNLITKTKTQTVDDIFFIWTHRKNKL